MSSDASERVKTTATSAHRRAIRRDRPSSAPTVLPKEVITQAWAALVTHRFRASLTMLGIAWGIVKVVLLMAYGNGFDRALLIGFQNAFSRGTVVMWGGQTSSQAGGERRAPDIPEGGRCRSHTATRIDQAREP